MKKKIEYLPASQCVSSNWDTPKNITQTHASHPKILQDKTNQKVSFPTAQCEKIKENS